MSSTLVRKAVPALVWALGALFAVPTGATPPGQNGKIVWHQEPKGDGFPHLFVANQDGSSAQRVFGDAADRGEVEGTFSPTDPNVMFFTRFAPRPFAEDLYMGNLSTGDVSRVRRADSADLAPTVSPDGTKIAYFAVPRPQEFDPNVPPPPERIHVMNIDGSGDKAITPRRQHSVDPDWSPDGSQIVYMQARFTDNSAQSRLVVMNADGSDRQPLTNFGGVEKWNPKWMPDGETIVFERYRETGKLSNIATINVTDGTQQAMLATKSWETNPIPSPDGTRIAFTSNRDRLGATKRHGRGFEVYTMALDGSDIVRVTDNRRPDILPDWQRLP
jgi:Tol biopolymer transport system component